MAGVPKRDLGFALRIVRNVILGVSRKRSMFMDICFNLFINWIRFEVT